MPLAVTPDAKGPRNSDSTSAKDNRPFFVVIAVLAVLGIAVSAVSLQRHYAKSQTKFCDIAVQFNCDIVNRSEFSSFFGIPVAGIGVAGYAIILALATIYRLRHWAPNVLLAGALAGLVFALYLTYVEGFVLDTWCILCLSSLAIIASISALAGVINSRMR
ncbi:MAG TPA: vitamin K epoxide reductase family protein [Candidatus Aquilonibacter sp.]|nr:vitamin K epoxide reductase family protein [Candidatus Aquilonibacter sp.]